MTRRRRAVALVVALAGLATLAACSKAASPRGRVLPTRLTVAVPQGQLAYPSEVEPTPSTTTPGMLWSTGSRPLGTAADGTFAMEAYGDGYQGVDPRSGKAVWTIPTSALPGAMIADGVVAADHALFFLTAPQEQTRSGTPRQVTLSRFELGAQHPTWAEPAADLGAAQPDGLLAVEDFSVVQGVVTIAEGVGPHVRQTVGLSAQNGQRLWTKPDHLYRVDDTLWGSHGPVSPTTAAPLWSAPVDSADPPATAAHDGLALLGTRSFHRLSDGTPVPVPLLGSATATMAEPVCGWDDKAIVVTGPSGVTAVSTSDPARVLWTKPGFRECSQTDDSTVALSDIGDLSVTAITPSTGSTVWSARLPSPLPGAFLVPVARSGGVVLCALGLPAPYSLDIAVPTVPTPAGKAG